MKHKSRSSDPTARKATRAIAHGRASIACALFSEGRFDPKVIEAIERTKIAVKETENAYQHSLKDPGNIVKTMQVLRAANELECIADETLNTANLGLWLLA